MNEITRLILLQQIQKAGKASVRQIIQIMDTSCRRMSHQNVDSLISPQAEPETPYSASIHTQPSGSRE